MHSKVLTTLKALLEAGKHPDRSDTLWFPHKESFGGSVNVSNLTHSEEVGD